jgi:hypothetical protein
MKVKSSYSTDDFTLMSARGTVTLQGFDTPLVIKRNDGTGAS